MTPTPTKQIKKAKKCLTVRQKLAVIEDVEVQKKSYSTVAEIYGISKSSVGDIMKKKNEYLRYKEQGRNLTHKKICMNPVTEEQDERQEEDPRVDEEIPLPLVSLEEMKQAWRILSAGIRQRPNSKLYDLISPVNEAFVKDFLQSQNVLCPARGEIES